MEERGNEKEVEKGNRTNEGVEKGNGRKEGHQKNKQEGNIAITTTTTTKNDNIHDNNVDHDNNKSLRNKKILSSSSELEIHTEEGKKKKKKGKAQHYTDSLTSNKTEGEMSSPKNRKPREGKSLSEPGPSAALPSPGAPQLVSRSRQVTAALGPRKLTPGSNSIKNNTVRI